MVSFDRCMGEEQHAAYCPAFVDPLEVSFFVVITGHIPDISHTIFPHSVFPIFGVITLDDA
jgi:hypothetical protein